jgi:hypothetical protein
MKRYMVLVECEDYIEVEADSAEEAQLLAVEEIDNRYKNNWRARVMHVEDI